jgi:hypothetical protein
MNKPHLLKLLVLVGLSLALVACAPEYAITTTHVPLTLGDTTVDVVVHQAEAPGLTYFNLHDNENTSVRAALDVIGEHGGRVIELKHSGERTIKFNLGGVSYEFDPNRMFTEPCLTSTLERFSNPSDEAINAISTFASQVLQQLDLAGLEVIITVHNTPRGSYTIDIYSPGGDLASEAELVYISEEMSPQDFYFVTGLDTYDQLHQMEQNVVLQDNSGATDDGSLSVWSAQQGLAYVNVEAQDGHRRQQAEMLLHLHEMFYDVGSAAAP